MNDAVNARQQIIYSADKGNQAMKNLEEAIQLVAGTDMALLLSNARKSLRQYLFLLDTCDYNLGSFIIGLDADGRPKQLEDGK